MDDLNQVRTERVGVMVTPAMKAQLDQLARLRNGHISISSTVYDILTLFFAQHETVVTQNGAIQSLQDPQ